MTWRSISETETVEAERIELREQGVDVRANFSPKHKCLTLALVSSPEGRSGRDNRITFYGWGERSDAAAHVVDVLRRMAAAMLVTADTLEGSNDES